jgi:hypothetical protein
MATPTIDISKFKADLEADFERVEIELDLIIQAGLADGVQEAVTRVPKNLGGAGLSGSINYEKIEPLVYSYFANQFYATFVEFGTKKYRKPPAGYEQLADESGREAMGNPGAGKGLEAFKKSILLWMSQKQIDPKYAFVIMRQILRDGIKPQPFFVPGLEKALAIIKDNFIKLKV